MATQGESQFDPESAPRFPVLTLEVREGADGAEVWFDGVRVPVGADGAEVLETSDARLYEAGIASAASRAAQRAGLAKCVRVLALTPDSAPEEFVVEGDGTVHRVGEAGVRRSRTSSWGSFTRQQKAVVVGASVAAALAAGALLGVVIPSETAARGPAEVAASPTGPVPTVLPVLGPSGEVETAAWSSAPVAGERVPVVIAAGVLVTVSADGELVGLSLDSGRQLWRYELDGASASTQLSSTTAADGVARVTAVTGSAVATVDPASGRAVMARSLDRDEEALAVHGGVVVRTAGVGASVQDPAGRWSSRVVPPGAAPLAQVGPSLVSMNAQGQWWSVTSSMVPATPARLPSPAKGAVPRGVIASTPAGLLFAWTTSDGTTQLLQQYSWSDLSKPVRTVSAGRPGAGAPRAASVSVSQDGTWVILDQDLVDLTSGKVTKLPQDWRTDIVLVDRAHAMPSEVGLRYVTRAGKVATADRPTGKNASPLAQSGSLAVVASAADGVAARLYGLQLDKSDPAVGSRGQQ